MRTLRAVVLLTVASVVRLLREGLVLRSMIWPGLVCAGTLAATLIALVLVRPGQQLAVAPGTDPQLVAAFESEDFTVRVVADPAGQVRSGLRTLATDGRTVWALGTSWTALEIEAILRERRGAPWRPVPPEPPAPSDRAVAGGDIICRAIGLLFVLYGLVFGLGGVARDRDAGILEIELSLPIPRWAGGMARWLSSTIVLAAFFVVTVVLFGALVPVREPVQVVLHGVAACATAVAVGLGVVGTSGLKQGFSGPFALGMTVTTGLASAGVGLGLDFLPVASLFSDAPGWISLAVSAGIGVVAVAVYGRRSAG